MEVGVNPCLGGKITIGYAFIIQNRGNLNALREIQDLTMIFLSPESIEWFTEAQVPYVIEGHEVEPLENIYITLRWTVNLLVKL